MSQIMSLMLYIIISIISSLISRESKMDAAVNDHNIIFISSSGIHSEYCYKIMQISLHCRTLMTSHSLRQAMTGRWEGAGGQSQWQIWSWGIEISRSSDWCDLSNGCGGSSDPWQSQNVTSVECTPSTGQSGLEELQVCFTQTCSSSSSFSGEQQTLAFLQARNKSTLSEDHQFYPVQTSHSSVTAAIFISVLLELILVQYLTTVKYYTIQFW